MQAGFASGVSVTFEAMDATITDDDVGKTVESADGEPLGTVVDVEAETAGVEPEPEMTDSIAAVLDWDGGSGETVPLEGDAVDEVPHNAVQLRAAVSAESVALEGEPDCESEDVRSDDHTVGSKP
ncbi:hypothetical protein [Natrinema halophilum]|uniref:PRC-barrel domain-containing protein n=1 Tax=Natrinema halophilum TaxID=1699371 RepID=A0A7D5GH62_9EURY|nr:hypothetical protein [Natrinema halophilum]QLG48827.1 hypothetical protein HYG82_08185 [Natrinema halophilum]